MKSNKIIETGNQFLFHEFDSILGWNLKPQFKGILTRGNEYKVVVEHNSHGMRNEEVEKNKKRKRIAVMGDSYTYGFGVEQKDIFSSKISYDNYEVLNFGVSAFGSDQLLLQLIHKIFEFKPDIILYLHTINTEIRNCKYFHLIYPKPILLMDTESGKMRFYSEHLQKNSFSLNEDIKSIVHKKIIIFMDKYKELLTEIAEYLSVKNKNVLIENKDKINFLNKLLNYNEENYYRNFMMYSLTEYIFSQVVKFCGEKDIKLIFIIGTSIYQFNNDLDKFNSKYKIKINKKMPNMRISSILKRLNVDYIDLYDKLLTLGKEDNHFKIDGHWNSYGHANVANIINEYLNTKS